MWRACSFSFVCGQCLYLHSPHVLHWGRHSDGRAVGYLEITSHTTTSVSMPALLLDNRTSRASTRHTYMSIMEFPSAARVHYHAVEKHIEGAPFE